MAIHGYSIGGYFISGYWWLLMIITLVAIILMIVGEYFISGYWWILVDIILMVIGDFLLVSIDGYFIGGY